MTPAKLIWQTHFGSHRFAPASQVHRLPPVLKTIIKRHTIRLLHIYYWCPHKPRGLGDLVHLLATPFALLIDRLFGTRLQRCPACQKRRHTWNLKHPFRRRAAP